MSVQVHIIDGALGAPAAWGIAGAGALLCFEVIVRGEENGRPIAALDYEVYDPMASKMLEKIGRELFERHKLLGINIEHSRGRVVVGAVSYRLRVASRHRKECIAALDEFTDCLKKDVPIWKTARDT